MQDIEIFSSYGLGHMARRRGVRKSENPFSEIGTMYGNWNSGWEHANEELPPLTGIKSGASAKVILLKEIK